MPRSTPIFRSRVSGIEPRLLFGRLTLYPNHVVLFGWRLRGPYRRSIPLDRIDEVSWRTRSHSYNLTIRLLDGDRLLLRAGGPGRWKFAIDEQRTAEATIALARAALPD